MRERARARERERKKEREGGIYCIIYIYIHSCLCVCVCVCVCINLSINTKVATDSAARADGSTTSGPRAEVTHDLGGQAKPGGLQGLQVNRLQALPRDTQLGGGGGNGGAGAREGGRGRGWRANELREDVVSIPPAAPSARIAHRAGGGGGLVPRHASARGSRRWEGRRAAAHVGGWGRGRWGLEQDGWVEGVGAEYGVAKIDRERERESRESADCRESADYASYALDSFVTDGEEGEHAGEDEGGEEGDVSGVSSSHVCQICESPDGADRMLLCDR